MAQRGTPLAPFVQARLAALRRQGHSVSACARACGVSRPTARKYLRGVETEGERRAA